MPYAVGGNSRIKTNTAAENAYNALDATNRDIALRQLRLSTGRRINNAGDDVAGYITSRALTARNGSMQAALLAVGDAQNVSSIMMDSLENINNLLIKIKDASSQAASGAMGTDERVALARAAYRLAQQIQTVVDTTVFGGRQLLDGNFSVDFVIGSNASNSLMTLTVDMTFHNPEFNVESKNFNLNASSTSSFAGITGLDMTSFNLVSSTNLGLFSTSQITLTLTSLANAINNVNKVASFVGGIVNRLDSQMDILKGQITNYNAAISRIEDADVAKEQLELVKSQFLQQSSLTSLAQANQNPASFLQLIRGT
ncbi:MAG TPA: flagellin [Candidatus Kapabacteria bacterium]|nr:flagellin [Candidatus Kapabacteria bacterium]HOV92083.1 flagellin [Candidatus Kapabacteria bacterium]